MADATWLALNVVSGGGGFSSSQPIGVTKIAKSVIAPLADQNISVFMLSTYQTDFILVTAVLHPRALGSVNTPTDRVYSALWILFSGQIRHRSGVPRGHRSSVIMAQLGSRSLPHPTQHLPLVWAVLGLTWSPGSQGWRAHVSGVPSQLDTWLPTPPALP